MSDAEYLEWLALERDAELKLATGRHARIKAPMTERGRHMVDAIKLNTEMSRVAK